MDLVVDNMTFFEETILRSLDRGLRVKLLAIKHC
jgi:hypothetical protein